MSKDEKKSSPSPSHGLLFDPTHLLGVHPLAASGFPFPHLNPLANPWLGQPSRFPGLFGGLGGIPNPLHAAALSHSLAAGSSDWWRLASEHISVPTPLPASTAAVVSTPGEGPTAPASTPGGGTPSALLLPELDHRAHNPIGLGLLVGNLGLLTPAAALGPLPSVEATKSSIGLLLSSPLELTKSTSFFGLSKHHNEIGSPPPPPSPIPTAHKRGRSSRASTSTHKQASRSSPSSTSPHPPSSPYLPSWSINGSSLPYSHMAGESKQKSSSSSSTSSKRQKLSSTKSESRDRDSAHKIPQAHQQPHSSPLLTIPTAHSGQDHKSSTDKLDGFTFDPRAMITPYQMSPELAFMSQSLFLHRPDLAIPPHFLASAAASSLPASVAGASSSPSSSSLSLSAAKNSEGGGHRVSPSVPSSSKHSSSKISSSSSRSEKSRVDKERAPSEESNKRKPAPSNGIRNNVESHQAPKAMEQSDCSDDKLLGDIPYHMLDGNRKKQIADQIRKRVGMFDHEEDLSMHRLKHSDWPFADAAGREAMQSGESSEKQGDYHFPEKQKKRDNHHKEPSQQSTGQKVNQKFEHYSEKSDSHEAVGHKTEELLHNKPFFGDESMSSTLDESCESIGHSEHEESRLDNSSASENVDVGSQSGSDSEDSQSGKNLADGSTDEGSPNKKRAPPAQLDERELIIPLEHGWNRQTIINGMGRRGIVGEVLYFAPCGKKMKTIPDVMRYLERNPNSDLGREHFSFNTKVNIGHFYEVRGGQDSQPVPLSDAEVLEKIEMSRGKRARMQMLARQRREKAAREQALAQQVLDLKLKRRMELQDISQQAAIARVEKQEEKQRQKELEKKERENKVIERRKEKEQHKINKQQEKLRIQEQLRKERELKAQQIIEARNQRQRELEEMRLADALQRNKERDMKRQQLVILKEQEKERRRQHLLLLKGLEQRKRLEEKQTKERLREEKLHEKFKQKEIKLHQRRVEMEIAMELKKPVEDMELKNAQPLPEFPRIKSKLAGRPIADCLMAVEFLNNFGLALNLEKSSIPTRESLERGIMNESDEDIEEFMSLVMHLLRFALDDVGVPNPKEAVTKLHQKITEMEMTDTTMSEILRIFLKARGEKQMTEWLIDKPMEALNPTKKAAILAFLCNELLTSKVIANEIDKHMDAINNLRRDKWVVEGQLRQLRVFQARKFNKVHKSSDRRPVVNSSAVQDEDTMSSSKIGSDDEEEKDEDEDKEEDEESESDDSSSVMTTSSSSNMPFEPVDENLTKEESDKKIDKLRKQHAAYRQKVFRASLRLRAINVGQDRYKRTYWILPLTGGVYVEGMESGVPEDYAAEQAKKEEGKDKVSEETCKENSGEGTVAVDKVKEENDTCETNDVVKVDKETISDSCNSESLKVKVEEEESMECLAEETTHSESAPSCEEKVKVNLEASLDETSEAANQSHPEPCEGDIKIVDGSQIEADSKIEVKVTVTSVNSVETLSVSQQCIGAVSLSAVSPQNATKGCGESLVSTAHCPADKQDASIPTVDTGVFNISSILSNGRSELPGCSVEPPAPKPALGLDILKVPRVGGLDRGTLATLLNNSIQQAYREEDIAGVRGITSPPGTPVSTPSATALISTPSLASSIPSLLTSSLLFSAIPKLPQPAHCTTLDLTCKPKGPVQMESPAITSTPVPAHSKPVNPQSLPPFHPSAQANLMLDLPPPAAHSGSTKTSVLPPPGPSHHLTQSPFIPGLPHYPFGLSSASETLSSLASIVSPPPAHHNAVTMTSSISTPLTTAAALQPLTTPVSSTKAVYSKPDKNDKKEPLYSSSELLQQAASQVLRSAESNKLSPSPAGSKPASLKTSMDNDDTTSSEVVDHKLWFSILPRMPCDELSLSQRLHGQPATPSSSQQASPAVSASLTALTTYINSPTNANFDAMLPLIQSNPGLLSSDLLFTSLFNSPATPSQSPTPCSTPGADSAGEFKVPPPPDSNLSSYPWEVLRAVQGEAQPIPKNLQHGWWRIYDLAILKNVMSCMLNRGIREKNLQRSIHRYLDYAKLHCEFDTSGKTEPEAASDVSQNSCDVKLIKTEKQSADSKDSMDIPSEPSSTSELPVKTEGQETLAEAKEADTVKEEAAVQTEQSVCDTEAFIVPDDPAWWSVPCMHQIELAALEEVEALEERIFQASLQAQQGWKPNKDTNIQLVDRSVKEVSDNESYPLDMAISRLLELEANIERRYLKPPLIRSVQLNLSSLSSQSERLDGDFSEGESIPPGLLLWRQAVVSSESPAQLSLCTQLLAKSISWEKSIMRVTCQICSKDDNEAQLLLCDGCDKGYHTYCFKPKMDNIPDGDWYCFECVSKASGTPHCVVCGMPAGRIVGCSKCPRHIHLECLDPPLPRMPKRWQCSNCLSDKGLSKRSKKRKESLPTVQRISITKLVVKEEPIDTEDVSMASSSSCHTSPPVSLPSSSPEKCVKKAPGRPPQDTPSGSEKKKRKRKEKEEDLISPQPPKKKEKKEKQEKKEKKCQEKDEPEELNNGGAGDSEEKKTNNKDLIACGKLLSEMEKHADGWPFLKPVNKKQFPSYKKYIKFPMDFTTAKGKLKSKEFKHRQEFAADMRLIFNNCETFNEDDSDVGQAGFNMRQYFERRWLEMFPDDAP